MKNSKNFLKDHGWFIGLCIAFLAAGIALSTTWLSYQLNTDSTAYFSIAEKYADFNFRDAINGYWSPLISWLLVPWVWFGANLLIASKVTATLGGLLMLVVTYRFLLYRKVAKSITVSASLILGLFLIDMLSIQASVRDLLMATVTTTFVLNLIRFYDLPSTKKALWLGVLGALMFYTKGLGFYVFLALVASLAAWQWWTAKRRDTQLIVRRFAPVLITFFALVTPFIALISFKYHQPTISTVGDFAYSIYSPASKGVAFPIVAPLLPHNPSAMWYWEDPTYITHLIPEHDWSLIHNKAYYWNKIVWANISSTFVIFGVFGPAVAFGLLVAILGTLKRGVYRKDYIIFAGVAAIWVLGHVIIMTDVRYLITAGVLSVIPIGLWVEQLRKARVVSQAQIVAGITIITIASLLAIVPSLNRLKYDERHYHTEAQAVSGQLPKGSKIISEELNSYYTCYYLELKCLGVLAVQGEPAEYYKSLKSTGVKYYLYSHTQDNNAGLNEFTQTYFVKLSDHVVGGKHITIYRLK